MFNLNEIIREPVKKLSPYKVCPISCPIKLDAMESPYNLPEEILLEIIEKMKGLRFNRYPDSRCNNLREVISLAYQIPKEYILIGNGSDELILNILLSFGKNEVLYPNPTFEIYGLIAKMIGLNIREIPLKENFEINSKEFIEAGQNNLIFISYPNNPTGNCFSREFIYQIIEESNSLIVIDEAYFGFSDKTFLPEVKRYPNLIVTRTFSKMFSLASLRVGFLFAPPEIIEILLKVKLPYNINSFSQVAAKIILSKEDYFKKKAVEIIEERREMINFLKEIDGIIPYLSETNFVLFKVKGYRAKDLYHFLIKEGILGRNFENIPSLADCLRISIGTKEENKIFKEKIRKYFKKSKIDNFLG
ncbi:MAG: histidinol-phosphate transaminase [bacterium]